ncbi:hypothetical protein QCA50_007211 [Cerrena zonata]|uniref:Uncharacterized protein n=1 Tax=Cerrena zonata TaxID=2478898 RepID=A0AAW0GDJ1_9APHY
MSTHQTRYIPFTPADPTTFDFASARKDIINSLQKGILDVHKNPSSRHIVYVGNSGVLMMDWIVSSLPELPPISFTRIPSPATLPEMSPKENAVFFGEAIGNATLFLLGELQGTNPVSETTKEDCETCIRMISKAMEIAVNGERDVVGDGCEILFGRAGLLYAPLKLRSVIDSEPSRDESALVKSIRELCSDQQLGVLIDDIIVRGREGAITYAEELDVNERVNAPGLMWSWRGKRYLGGAHGVVGILQMIISSPTQLLFSHWGLIVKTILWLVDIQLPSGNWPVRAEKDTYKRIEGDEKNRLVHWCHGAPATLILFATILRRFDSASSPLALPPTLVTSLRKSLALGANLVYTQGLLRKGVGICHGVAGSVYTLLSVSDAISLPKTNYESPGSESKTKTEGMMDKYLFQAIHLAHIATTYESLTEKGEMNVPDRPYSLYEGLAGMCCAWVDIVKRLDRVLSINRSVLGDRIRKGSGMPAYDDLVWMD